jgi:cutinase
MAHVTLLKSMARLGAIASAIACASTLLAAAPASAQITCPDVEVIFARGTNDAPEMGRVGDAFVDALRPLVGGRTVNTYAVNYPASYDFLNTAEGANDAAAHVAAMVAQCPSTKLVLGGYSQGAAVVDMLAGIPPLGNKIGEIGSAPPLDSSLVPSIAAVVAFGNPSAKFSIPITNSVFGNRAVDICKDGDPICSRGRNPFAHSDYVTDGLAQQAASQVAGFI